jgi:hypothetical protein
MTTTAQPIGALLENSAATDEFKAAVIQVKGGRSSPLIVHNYAVPPVKAVRAICKLLEEAPDFEVKNVNIQGASGCSDFEGTLEVNGGERRYYFTWDCAWRAKQEGFVDSWGSPDQIRAAQQFGYQCFKKFELEQS